MKALIDQMGSVSRPVNYTVIGYNGSSAMRSVQFKALVDKDFLKTYLLGNLVLPFRIGQPGS